MIWLVLVLIISVRIAYLIGYDAGGKRATIETLEWMAKQPISNPGVNAG